MWRIRRGMDRRFRAGHPWVYSNELLESPKGIEPGDLVELQDAGGQFLARGMGNPQSLISFRTLTRDPRISDPYGFEELLQVLKNAAELRKAMGFGPYSHRLCFGEADGLAGLVIDRYVTLRGQVFVVQAHTGGADRILSQILGLLESLTQSAYFEFEWSKTGVVVRNDLSVRKLEGLAEEEPRVLREIAGEDLRSVQIAVRSVLDDNSLSFKVDLIHGQKTGFFLDQFANIQNAAIRFKDLPGKKIRILDLCCYVGQWGAQLGKALLQSGKEVEVLAVDASQQSLELAQKNIQAAGVECKIWKADVIKDLGQLSDQSFDIVISDPPALIKNRKDIPAGTHAYLQLATQAMRLVRSGGGIVCCSCSALLEEESFIQTLAKAAQRNRRTVQWVGRSAQSPDHPMLLEFPEGRYLKCWVGVLGKLTKT